MKGVDCRALLWRGQISYQPFKDFVAMAEALHQKNVDEKYIIAGHLRTLQSGDFLRPG